MEDGHVQWRDVDGEDIHEAINAGDEPWRNIIVELKKYQKRKARRQCHRASFLKSSVFMYLDPGLSPASWVHQQCNHPS